MQPKKIINLLLAAGLFGLVCSVASCKKYLSPAPVSSFDTAFVFGTVQNAQKAVLSAYSDMEGDNAYGIRVSMYFPYDNDEMIEVHQLGDGDRGDIAHYNAGAGNQQIYNPWVQLYQGVERANICIYYIPRMTLYTTGTPNQIAELHRLYGEALTLRAQFYLELIRNWGDVPAQWLPSVMEPTLAIPKTDRDTIYNHLLNDLAGADTLVPWRTDVTKIGDNMDERITLGAVKALRARIALYRGGYSLRRASSMYGQTMARPADYLDYYKIALQECSDIMARPDEHTLNPSFQAVFKNGPDAHTLDNTYGEIIFQVGMSGGVGATDSKLGYYDGTKIDGNSLTGNAAILALPTYFYLFDSTDTRRDVTCAAYEVAKDNNTLTAHAVTSIVSAKFRRDWMTNPIEMASTAQYFGVNWPIIRFSDVLLMYAEADNEINHGPSAADIAAVTKVRTRGYGGNAALIGTIPTDYTGFFNYIVRERSLEFGGEGIRKYDLIRWNLLAARLADAKTNMTNLAAAANTSFTGSYISNVWNFSKLPLTTFAKTTSNISTGVVWGTSLYVPATLSSLSGYSKITWISSSNILTLINPTSSSGEFAADFKPNHSELFPIPQNAIAADANLTQDYGY